MSFQKILFLKGFVLESIIITLSELVIEFSLDKKKVLFQLGVSLGFLIPPIIVDNTSTHDNQARQFYIMFGTMAGLSTVILASVLICK